MIEEMVYLGSSRGSQCFRENILPQCKLELDRYRRFQDTSPNLNNFHEFML